MRDHNLPLHLKYRPQTFDEVFGNDSVKESLKTILYREEGVIRSFLFTGEPGCGKTTFARIMGRELECEDLREYNSANVRGIDTIREIADDCRYAPRKGKVKIYLLDEAHKLTNDAQNALLKMLEDTRPYIRFILCTTDPEKLIKTIRTRCSVFHVSPLRRNQTIKLLKWICDEEKMKISDSVIDKIVDCSNGSPRQAIVYLDQIIDLEDEELMLKTLVDNTVDETSVLELCQKLLTRPKWETVAAMLKNIDEEPEKVRLAIYTYMGKVLLSGNERAAEIMEFFEDPIYSNGKSALIKSCFYICKK